MLGEWHRQPLNKLEGNIRSVEEEFYLMYTFGFIGPRVIDDRMTHHFLSFSGEFARCHGSSQLLV